MNDLKTIRQQCKDFAKKNLAECCAEIVELQDTAILRDGKVRELAAMAGSVIGNHDTLRVAESFISRAAIEAATAAPTDAIPELRNAFITLESSGGEGRTIVLKFNQREDAYAVHDFLLKGGKAAPTDAQPDGLTLSKAMDASYPIPDTPHASVRERAMDDRKAFMKGWNACVTYVRRPAADQAAQSVRDAAQPIAPGKDKP